jgi:hypothetical protein
MLLGRYFPFLSSPSLVPKLVQDPEAKLWLCFRRVASGAPPISRLVFRFAALALRAG